ncbi:hypothetical protein [Agromyces sp. Root81]|uniref:hypothetical protein n=1 Tax=Agromyces sp. Root81 TaxID=1736601 RepID=UPI00190FC6D3|nr:hypothetical protein [Agromyces sp. Root81]
MSESNRPAEPQSSDETGVPDTADPRDDLEGSYTEVDGEAPHERTVAGEYTHTDGAPDEETSVGDYTSTDKHPDAHDADERHGKFVRSEPPKPHPGMHHI